VSSRTRAACSSHQAKKASKRVAISRYESPRASCGAPWRSSARLDTARGSARARARPARGPSRAPCGIPPPVDLDHVAGLVEVVVDQVGVGDEVALVAGEEAADGGRGRAARARRAPRSGPDGTAPHDVVDQTHTEYLTAAKKMSTQPCCVLRMYTPFPHRRSDPDKNMLDLGMSAQFSCIDNLLHPMRASHARSRCRLNRQHMRFGDAWEDMYLCCSLQLPGLEAPAFSRIVHPMHNSEDRIQSA
jgi:hypothetical protein